MQVEGNEYAAIEAGGDHVDAGARLRLLFAVRNGLQEYAYQDQIVILREHDVHGLGDNDPWEDRGLSLGEVLHANADDVTLLSLGRFLQLPEAEGSEPPEQMPTPTGEPEPLFIFASHLDLQKKFLGEVEQELSRNGVALFVAHDSIPMDADWSAEIVNALRGCHAGAAFIHDGFKKSAYCQQEVGWLLGRDVPMARLLLGETPVALLSQKQGLQMAGWTAGEVATRLLQWAEGNAVLKGHLATSCANALMRSGNFRSTDILYQRMLRLGPLTRGQCQSLIEAAEQNDQVYRAIEGWSGKNYRDVLADLVVQNEFDQAFVDRLDRLRDKRFAGMPIPSQLGASDRAKERGDTPF